MEVVRRERRGGLPEEEGSERDGTERRAKREGGSYLGALVGDGGRWRAAVCASENASGEAVTRAGGKGTRSSSAGRETTLLLRYIAVALLWKKRYCYYH